MTQLCKSGINRTDRRRRKSALLSALCLLLCLNLCASAGCSFAGIRIERIDPGPANPTNPTGPTDPAPAQPTDPEPTQPTDPDPDPDAGEDGASLKTFTEAEFRQRRGDGWIVKALSFEPFVIRPMGESRLFAFGYTEDGADGLAAVVDLEAMTVLERTVRLLPPEEETPPPYWMASASAVGGIPCIVESELGFILRLDPETLRVTAREAVGGEYASQVLPLGENRAVFTMGPSGSLLTADLSEPDSIRLEEVKFAMPEGFDSYYLAEVTADGALIASFTGKVMGSAGEWDGYRQSYGMIDFERGTASLFETGPSVSLMVAGNCVVEDDYSTGAMTAHMKGAEFGEMRIDPPENGYLLWPAWNSGRADLLFTVGDGLTVSVVDLTTLKTAASFSVERTSEWDFFSSVGEMDRQIAAFLYEGEDYDCHIFYWERPEQDGGSGAAGTGDFLGTGGEEARSGELYPTLTRSILGEIRRDIDRIYEETGLSVYVGNEAVRYQSGYAVQAVTEPRKQLEGLKSLSEFFDHCPPGFIRELTEWNSAIDICLTGKILPEPGNRDSIGDASAFVTQTGGMQVMVVDVLQGGLTQTVAHEFLHIAENSMQNKHEAWWNGELEDPTDIFLYWADLNPEEFEYYYVYTDEAGTTLGSDADWVWSEWDEEQDVSGVYFMDGYSTTYPSEDRARIFENLAVRTTDELPGAFASEHIRLKAAYLCACLRRAFESVAAVPQGEVFWEQSLDPAYTYEYFEQNYIIRAEG